MNEIPAGSRLALLGHAFPDNVRDIAARNRQLLHRAFGRRNPERMNNEYWNMMVTPQFAGTETSGLTTEFG